MDYSLLLGVTRRRFDLQPTRPARTGSASDALSEPLMPEGSQFEAEFIDGPAIYYVGLIDILTRWDFEKRREYVVKTLVGKNRHGISCVPPREYVERFKRRVVEAIVEGRDNN
ncbi:hypothetical protein T492DRAFT_1077251 [Pavlovales sp. CCMP2436]|nr:hypothetical protein T492DRAFT_1077251 [Pavlovales sp. CCMP2436]